MQLKLITSMPATTPNSSLKTKNSKPQFPPSALWVDTLGHVGQYDYLRREIRLIAEQRGGILTITVNGYDQNKYVDIDSSLITIAIRNNHGYNLSALDDSVVMSTKGNTTFVTISLRTTAQLQLKITTVKMIDSLTI